MKKYIYFIAVLTVILSGCSAENNNLYQNNDLDIYDKQAMISENNEEFLKLESQEANVNQNISVPIELDEKYNVISSAEISDIYLCYETNTIQNMSNFRRNFKTIEHYDTFFNEDGSLKSEYVFVELSFTIFAEKKWDELLLTSFKLKYTYDNIHQSKEPKFVNECNDFENVHKLNAISVNANEKKDINIGYIISSDIFNNMDDVYLDVSFGDYDIDISKNIIIDNIEMYNQSKIGEQ